MSIHFLLNLIVIITSFLIILRILVISSKPLSKLIRRMAQISNFLTRQLALKRESSWAKQEELIQAVSGILARMTEAKRIYFHHQFAKYISETSRASVLMIFLKTIRVRV